jgi:hypothetical protein
MFNNLAPLIDAMQHKHSEYRVKQNRTETVHDCPTLSSSDSPNKPPPLRMTLRDKVLETLSAK